jgi:phosphoglycolate phosphatase
VGTQPIDLVVIDASGTAVHDDEAIATALIEALGVFDGTSYPGVQDDRLSYVAHTRGLPIMSVLRSLLGDEEHAQFAHHAFELALPSVLAQGGIHAVDGAEEALIALRDAGHRVCLMSRLSPRCLDAVVEQLGWRELVDLTVAPVAGNRTPPHPDLVLTAMVRLGVASVRDVAVVADSANTLVAGARAGASAVIGVLTGAQALAELQRVPHTHVVETLTEVPRLLEVVGRRVRAA